MIIADFAKIHMVKTDRPKVGIVGEIFVKYSPLANNDLERFLISEGAEVVVPGLIDFCLYCIYNSIVDYRLYGKNKKTLPVWKLAFRLFNKKKNDISRLIRQQGTFEGWTEFSQIIDIASGVISLAVKMGEGWLLTSEMVELAHSGCANIVCTQPFGCLPNHVVGKGVIKELRHLHPEANIVAIDYDPGASEVNQLNRIKLMLSTAFKNMEELHKEVRNMAMKEFESYVRDAVNYTPAFKHVGERMIQFAAAEPKLFQLLYMKEHNISQSYQELIGELGDTVEVCLEVMQKDYVLSREDAEKAIDAVGEERIKKYYLEVKE